MDKEQIQNNEQIKGDFGRLVERWKDAQQVCFPDEFESRQRRLLHELGVFVINFMQLNYEIIQPPAPPADAPKVEAPAEQAQIEAPAAE